MTAVKNLGFIKAIHSGATPPTNTQMLWYDTSVSLHKYYSTVSSTWVALNSGAVSWSAILGINAHSGTNSPIIDTGQSLIFERSGFQINLESSVLTDNRTIQLQDKSGVIALLSDLSGGGTLSTILASGNTTGGSSIQLSTGDLIVPVSGTASLNLRDGSDGIATLSSVTSINLTSGGRVNVGPTTTASSSNFVVSSNGSTTSEIRKNSASDIAKLAYFASTTEVASILANASGDFKITNYVTSRNITFTVNSTSEVFRVDAANQALNVAMNIAYTVTTAGDPPNSIDASNISTFEFGTTTATAFPINEILGGFSGKSLRILNIGIGGIVLQHNAVATASKILCPNSVNLNIGPNEGVTLHYSQNTNAWHILQNN